MILIGRSMKIWFHMKPIGKTKKDKEVGQQLKDQ